MNKKVITGNYMINQKELYEDDYEACYSKLQEIIENNPEYFESKKNILDLVNNGYYDLAMIFCSPTLKKDSEFMSQFSQYEIVEKTIKVEKISHYEESIEDAEINTWGQHEKYEIFEIDILIDGEKIMVEKSIHSFPLHNTDEMNINIDLFLQDKHISNCEVCIDIDTKIKDTLGYKIVKVFDIESCKVPEINEYKISLRKGEWNNITSIKPVSKNSLK